MVKTVGVSQLVHQRNYRRARDRALTRLRVAHLEEYKTYLAEERDRDEEMGNVWIIDDSNTSVAIITRSSTDLGWQNNPDNEGSYKSNERGEE